MCQREVKFWLGALSAGKESRPRTLSGGPSCKAHSAMQSPWQAPQTRSTATALAVARSGQQNGSHANAGLSSCSAQCCLTPRSSGAPTAGHQARSGGTRYIFASPGLASCRRRPLSSNVRPHTKDIVEGKARCGAGPLESGRKNQACASRSGKRKPQTMELTVLPSLHRVCDVQVFSAATRCSASRAATSGGASQARQWFVGPAATQAIARCGLLGRGGSRNQHGHAAAVGATRQQVNCGIVVAYGGTSTSSAVRPNHSFELTRYGRPAWLGGIRFANCVPPSQAVLPHRSAQFER